MIAPSDSPWIIPGIVARLRELHALSGHEALTMREIADRLSFEFEVEVSRNGVIGFCHRIGLPVRPNVPFLNRKSGQKPKHIHVRVEAPIAPIEAQLPATSTGLTILQLCEGVCHWPLGEIMDYPPFIYCGHDAIEGRPYCGEHCNKAYNTPRVSWA